MPFPVPRPGMMTVEKADGSTADIWTIEQTIVYGRAGDIKYEVSRQRDVWFNKTTETWINSPVSVYELGTCTEIPLRGNEGGSRKPPPPLRKRKRRDDDDSEDKMSCNCSINKEVLKELKKISYCLDADGWTKKGVEVPERLTWQNNKEPKQKKFSNYADLMGWWIQAFSDIFGQFETVIEIPDANPTEKGNQPLELRFPNLSELLSEMMMLVFDAQVNTQLLVQGQMRQGQLTFQGNLSSLKSYYMIKSLLGWVSLPTKSRKEKLETPFNMEGKNVEDFYEEGEITVAVDEFSGKPKETLAYHMDHYDEAADIVHQIHSVKMDSKGDMKKQMASWLLNHAKSIKDVAQGQQKEDLDDFIRKFEDNFVNEIPTNKKWKSGQGFGVKVRRHGEISNNQVSEKK
ncbi:MAG: hypothetical protein SAJ11_09710 [Jaaginema sp. PMC 1078.18]|nr:hypothetical protein [Jaaginema sp. PMC 1078.18]